MKPKKNNFKTEYTFDIQKLFLEIILHEPNNFSRVQNIYNYENFDRQLKTTAQFIAQHAGQYSQLPTREQIRAATGVHLEPIPDIADINTDWFLNEFEAFTRRQELERAILKSAELIEKGTYDPVEKLIKDAVQISLTRDLGIDYFDNPRQRLLRLKSNNGQVKTGWSKLDYELFGGINRGELTIFAGGSNSGKSLFLQNLALNWISQGLSGIYITLELSEDLTSMRIDSMTTGIGTRNLLKDLDNVELKLKLLEKKSGTLQIKYLPAQSNVNDIRAYVKELQIKTGKALDFILIDYLDLLMPVSIKVDPSDVFIKDKYISEELRNLAIELKCLIVTASQLNRSSVEESEYDHSHIAGGISKINTADNVFAIYTTRAMRERGRYQLQLLKTRSSNGLGKKVELAFDIDSMRIFDIDEDDAEDTDNNTVTSNSIMNRIKNSTTSPDNGDNHEPIDQNAKLKQMLARIKRTSE